jgi:DNA-binding LytR/AlgR family response regulator
MNCLLIDDNPKTAAGLTGLLEACKYVKQVYHGVNAFMVGTLMAAEEIDVVLIRVRLWDYKQFTKLEKIPIIVFLSGGRDKLTLKLGTSVKYGLREPFFPMDLSELFLKIKTKAGSESPNFLFLRYDGRFHKTLFSDIEMIERKEGSYVQFHLKYGSWLLPGTIPSWLTKLPVDHFIRVSDQLILPLREAVTILGNQYKFKGRTIQLSFRFAAGARNENANIK